jgi:hypothetical protein
MTEQSQGKITSLRNLPSNIEPPRDLWQGIEAQIAADKANQARPEETRGRPGTSTVTPWRRRAGSLRVLAAAAVVAALAVGVWIGRSALPGGAVTDGGVHSNPQVASTVKPDMTQSPYMVDARYNRDRAVLVKNLEAQLTNLPPDTRQKVITDLTVIRNSMRDLESALGRDPSNALLQELLVNTYQDEMRVLTAVQDAGNSGKGI